MKLYDELAEWYPLLTPLEDYAEESRDYLAALRSGLGPGRHTLLELGAGAGHNAHYFAGDFDLCLVDASAAMLVHARRTCPGAEFHVADMRDVRLGRQFDAVFVHDAVVYLRTLGDLRALFQTARVHLRPGGLLLIAPDYVVETFQPATECGGSDGDGRALRYLGWVWQAPGETETIVVDYVVSTRIGTDPPVVHTDRHLEGLFPRAVWLALFAEAGFEVEQSARSNPDGDRELDLFVGRRTH